MYIEGHRIYIRNFKIEDREAVHEYASNKDVVRFMNWGPNTMEETDDFIYKAIKNNLKKPRLDYDLAIIEKASDTLVGGVGIYLERPSNGVGVIGYTLNPRFWRLGYGSEVAKLIVEFGFNRLKLNEIEATCDTRNIGSRKVLEGAGLRRKETIKNHMLLRDGYRDSFVYGMTKEDYLMSHC